MNLLKEGTAKVFKRERVCRLTKFGLRNEITFNYSLNVYLCDYPEDFPYDMTYYKKQRSESH